MKRLSLILVLLLTAVASLAAQNTPGGVIAGNKPNVLDYIISPNSVVFSKTLSEWNSAWQQWSYSMPVANHPLFIDTLDCSAGQSGPVWFLGGKYCQSTDAACGTTNVQRICKIPYGKFIYFPVWNGEDSALEENVAEHPGDMKYQQIGYMRSFEDPWAQGALPSTYFATIDGVRVPHLERYLVQSTVFSFTLPDNNLLEALYPAPNNVFPAGSYYPAVDQGNYLMLAPLPPGLHSIHFGASWGQFAFDVNYAITVTK